MGNTALLTAICNKISTCILGLLFVQVLKQSSVTTVKVLSVLEA